MNKRGPQEHHLPRASQEERTFPAMETLQDTITLSDIIGVTAEDLDAIRHRRNRAVAEDATPQAVAASLKDIAALLTAVGQLQVMVQFHDLIVDRLEDALGTEVVNEAMRKIQAGDKPRRRVS